MATWNCREPAATVERLYKAGALSGAEYQEKRPSLIEEL
jgi:hypothetical protein